MMELRFKSKWTSLNRPLTSAQKLAEMMSERLFSSKGMSLPIKFWNLKPYKQFWFYQMLLANKLLKRYPAQVIMKCLRSSRAKNVYSLAAVKILYPLFDKELIEFNKLAYQDPTEIDIDIDKLEQEEPRPIYQKESKFKDL